MQQNIEFRSKRKVSLGSLGRVDRQVVPVCLLVGKLQLMNTFLYRLLIRLDLRFDATKYLISQYQKSASGLIRWSGQAGCPHAELPCCC